MILNFINILKKRIYMLRVSGVQLMVTCLIIGKLLNGQVGIIIIIIIIIIINVFCFLIFFFF